MLSSLSVWGALLWEKLAPYFLLLFWAGVYSATGTEREVDGPASSNESWSVAGVVVISCSDKLSLGAISIDASSTTMKAKKPMSSSAVTKAGRVAKLVHTRSVCFQIAFLLKINSSRKIG